MGFRIEEEEEEVMKQRAKERMGFRIEEEEEEVILQSSVMEKGWISPSSNCSRLTMSQCRICHEEEDQNFTSMESPCACSGTIKFAHRICIQKWCDEKGSTVCEICLQNFQPGFIVAPKDSFLDIGASTRNRRNSYEVSIEENENSSDHMVAMEQVECSPASIRIIRWYRYIAMTLTVMLLLKHLISVISLGDTHDPLTLFFVILLRATGIFLPFYLITRTISEVQRLQKEYRRCQTRPFHGTEAAFLEDHEGGSHRIQIGD